MSKRIIVVLANSVKHHQHCVAGKCIHTKEWIRPVSNATGAELSHEQVKYQNPHGTFSVKPKQKVEIGVIQHAPLINQPENYIIDGSIWQQRYKINDNELQDYLDSPIDLWGSGDRVLYSNIENEIITINQSLYLVQVENLHLYKNQFDKRRASFNYKNQPYDFAVTDPRFDTIIEEEEMLKNILCISLGENYDGNCYKLVATIY